MQDLWKPKEAFRGSGAGVTVTWDSNLRHLTEESVLLTSNPSLQPLLYENPVGQRWSVRVRSEGLMDTS